MPRWFRRRDGIANTGEIARGSLTISDVQRTATVDADALWDLYKHNEIAKLIIRKKCKACFHNGFTEDLPKDVVLELMRADLYKRILGWSVVLFEDGNVQAWNAYAKSVGVKVASYDETGYPETIDVYYDAEDHGKKWTVSGRNEKFFVLRTFDGLPGWKGDSELLALYKTLNRQEAILDDYGTYVYLWGKSLIHVVDSGVEGAPNPTALLESTKNALTGKLKGGEIVVTGPDKEIRPSSLMQGSYDPINILTFQNGRIAGASEMNKTMLDGDPSGHLSSSEVALAAFYASVKEDQDEILFQLKPLLLELGLSDEVAFADPTEMPAASQAAFVRETVASLQALGVDNEQALRYVNQVYGTNFEVS